MNPGTEGYSKVAESGRNHPGHGEQVHLCPKMQHCGSLQEEHTRGG